MTSHTATKAKQQRVRILIADDHPAVRKTVRTMLQRHPRFEVCGEAEDGSGAISEAERLKPDVVVLDVTMPVLNGFEAARGIKNSLPKTPIIMLSANADKGFVDEAKRIGARAYVAKTRVGEALVKTIEAAVLDGDFEELSGKRDEERLLHAIS